MKFDMVLAGVGGQGGLSAAVLVARAAMAAGLHVKQSEVHGMAQRGGEVVAHLRISDSEVQSPTVPFGCADLLLSFEPLEALRYLPWLSADSGCSVSAIAPVRNIPDYPDIESVLAALRGLPRTRLLDADTLAKEAGSARSANVALLGAAASLLPVSPEAIEREIRAYFGRKGEQVVQANLGAFAAGRRAS